MSNITEINIPQTTQISLAIDTNILTDIDTLSKQSGIARVKIINAILDHYLHHNELILNYGSKKFDVSEILGLTKKE